MRAFLVFLLVLAGAAVAGDLVAERVATSAAESRLAAHGVGDPEVEVSGFPFLTQLLSRDFSEVHVTGSTLEVGGARAEDVSVTGHDVTAPAGGDVTVGRLAGVGLVTYDEVIDRSGARGVRLEKGDSPDKVRVVGSVDVLGETLDVAAVSRVRASGDTVRVTPRSFELADGGTVGTAVEEQLADRFTLTYRMSDLPDGVSLRGVRAADDGFLVRVVGRDVVFADLG